MHILPFMERYKRESEKGKREREIAREGGWDRRESKTGGKMCVKGRETDGEQVR